MFKNLWIASLLLLGSLTGTGYEMPQNFQSYEVAYVWESDPDFLESKRVFLEAFVKCYDQIPLDVLRKSSREEMIHWLEEVFDEVYAEAKTVKTNSWLSAKVEGKTVGFLVVDFSNYPEEIYLAQLAVDPAYQGKGIASSMVRSVLDQFSECSKFVVITRSANHQARGLYSTLGFSPSSYRHEGYNQELYTGFEYSKSTRR